MTDVEKLTLKAALAAQREGQLVPGQVTELNALLRDHADARRRYLENQYLRAALHWLYAEADEPDEAAQAVPESRPVPLALPLATVTPAVEPARPAPPPAPVIRRHVITRMHLAGATAICGAVFVAYLFTLTWGMFGKENRQHEVASERPLVNRGRDAANSDRQVATITASEDAKWQTDAQGDPDSTIQHSALSIQHSKIAPIQPLNLASGTIAIKLNKGVKLLIQGPAEWTVDGDNSATLKRGKLVAQVPPEGVGFTLRTPTARIVDLGTEFGVVVANTGVTSLQVLKGEVTLARSAENSEPVRLVAGEARRVRAAESGGVGPIEKIPFRPLEVAVGSPGESPLDRWHEASRTLRTDPGLVAYYDFESGGNALKNVLADRLHGEIVTARPKPPWTNGRWHGKGALAFGEGFARVRIADDLGLRTRDDRTYALWFRLDAVPRHDALLIGRGNYPQRSFAVWVRPDQPNAALWLSLNQANGSLKGFGQSGVLQPGRWHLVAAVLTANRARLFHNGVELKAPLNFAGPAPESNLPLMLGQSAEPENPEHFTGVIDELAIFRRALSAEEINQLYQEDRLH